MSTTRRSARWILLSRRIPEMSATEAQQGLAYEFEFEFDLKFDDGVRVRDSAFKILRSRFRVRVSGILFGIRFRSHFGSIWGSIFGAFRDPGKDPKRTTLGNGVIPTIAWGIARGNAGLRPSRSIAQSPSHSLSHPSDGFATTPARTAAARASVIPVDGP